jgi:hypothetical protein
MDIYEFTQALWRRKWLLLSGVVLLIAFVSVISIDFTDGISLRSNLSYEASVQMAVVPEEFESLTQDVGGNSLAGPAGMFASLLASPQAALEIEQQLGTPVLGLEVSSTGRDRFIAVSALSDSPEGAVAAALASFRWLEQRLSKPVALAEVLREPPPPTPSLLDSEGRMRTVVRLELDHALSNEAEGLWLVAGTDSNEQLVFKLSDAADERFAAASTLVTPGEAFSLTLEDDAGRILDEEVVDLPGLPPGANASYELIVGINRGFVRGLTDDPRIDPGSVKLHWVPGVTLTDQTVVEGFPEVTVLLLTDSPIPASIGGRRTPLLIVAFLTAGIVALIVLAVTVDSWIQERRKRMAIASDAEHASVPTPISLSTEGESDHRRLVGS